MSFHWRFAQFGSSSTNVPHGNFTNCEARTIKLRQIEVAGEKKSITVRLVKTVDKISEACALINQRYHKKGYGSAHRIPFTDRHITFTAELDGKVVATITLAVDAGRGLAADNTFKHAIDGLRATGRTNVCELTKFAFDGAFRSREVMAALFHIVYIYGFRNFACSDLLIEVHPRHACFYEAMLGFERLGGPAVNQSVGTPLQLMRIETDRIRAGIDAASAGSGPTSSHSLYPLFLPAKDEEGIFQRLMSAEAAEGDVAFADHDGRDQFSSRATVRALEAENARLRQLLARALSARHQHSAKADHAPEPSPAMLVSVSRLPRHATG